MEWEQQEVDISHIQCVDRCECVYACIWRVKSKRKRAHASDNSKKVKRLTMTVVLICKLSILRASFDSTTNRQTKENKKNLQFSIETIWRENTNCVARKWCCRQTFYALNWCRWQISVEHTRNMPISEYETPMSLSMHYFDFSFCLFDFFLSIAQISRFAREHSDKSGKWADRNIEIVHWSE